MTVSLKFAMYLEGAMSLIMAHAYMDLSRIVAAGQVVPAAVTDVVIRHYFGEHISEYRVRQLRDALAHGDIIMRAENGRWYLNRNHELYQTVIVNYAHAQRIDMTIIEEAFGGEQ